MQKSPSRVTATIRSCGARPAVINRIESMSRETVLLLVDAESRPMDLIMTESHGQARRLTHLL